MWEVQIHLFMYSLVKVHGILPPWVSHTSGWIAIKTLKHKQQRNGPRFGEIVLGHNIFAWLPAYRRKENRPQRWTVVYRYDYLVPFHFGWLPRISCLRAERQNLGLGGSLGGTPQATTQAVHYFQANSSDKRKPRVVSRVMRKFNCRLRPNEVSRQ